MKTHLSLTSLMLLSLVSVAHAADSQPAAVRCFGDQINVTVFKDLSPIPVPVPQPNPNPLPNPVPRPVYIGAVQSLAGDIQYIATSVLMNPSSAPNGLLQQNYVDAQFNFNLTVFNQIGNPAPRTGETTFQAVYRGHGTLGSNTAVSCVLTPAAEPLPLNIRIDSAGVGCESLNCGWISGGNLPRDLRIEVRGVNGSANIVTMIDRFTYTSPQQISFDFDDRAILAMNQNLALDVTLIDRFGTRSNTMRIQRPNGYLDLEVKYNNFTGLTVIAPRPEQGNIAPQVIPETTQNVQYANIIGQGGSKLPQGPVVLSYRVLDGRGDLQMNAQADNGGLPRAPDWQDRFVLTGGDIRKPLKVRIMWDYLPPLAGYQSMFIGRR